MEPSVWRDSLSIPLIGLMQMQVNSFLQLGALNSLDIWQRSARRCHEVQTTPENVCIVKYKQNS
jgi:hypothetical protein